MRPDASVRRNPQICWRRTLNGAVLLAPDGQILRLNPSAGEVWELLEERGTPEDIARELAATYGICATTMLGEVTVVIDDFRARGLLLGSP